MKSKSKFIKVIDNIVLEYVSSDYINLFRKSGESWHHVEPMTHYKLKDIASVLSNETSLSIHWEIKNIHLISNLNKANEKNKNVC